MTALRGNSLASGFFFLLIFPLSQALTDREVLVQFFEETQGNQWFRAEHWGKGSTIPICQWWGVTCASTSSWSDQEQQEGVTEIRLPKNNVAHNIATLFQLSHLRFVDLKQNPIDQVGLLGNLEETINGSSAFDALALEAVDLTNCLLTDISGISRASETLRELRLARNQLKGGVPEEFDQLSRLEILDLSHNAFRGSLPSNSSQMLRLRELYLNDNNFTGSIPESIGRLSNLRVLDLAHNQLEGALPLEAINSLSQLMTLNLEALPGTDESVLSGPLPLFPNASRLTNLRLAYNQFSGSLSSDLMAGYISDVITADDEFQSEPIDEMVTIDVGFNRLTGTLPESLVDRFPNLSLNIVGNRLEGPLPSSYCLQSSWMQGQVADLGCDAIACPSGTFQSPDGRSNSAKAECVPCDNTTQSPYIGATQCGVEPPPVPEPMILTELYQATSGPDWTKREGWDALVQSVEDSQRNGNLTDDSLPTLQVCELQGIICNAQGHVSMITLSNNGLVGTIPSLLFQLPHLVSLDLSENLVELDEDDDWLPLQYAHSLSRLRMSHTRINTLRHVSKAPKLTELAMDGNSLNGGLPDELFLLTHLVDLQLQASFATGSIPADIAKLTNLKRQERICIRGTHWPHLLLTNFYRIHFLDFI